MKTDELKNKSKKELEKLLSDIREKLRVLKFSLSAGKVKDVRQAREYKKTIARILTLLKQSE